MRFESPWFLLLLGLLLPWWWLSVRRNNAQFIQFSEVQTLKTLATTTWWSHPYVLPILRGLALIFLILAVARPQTGRSFTEIETEGVDIILAIDTSGSMRALDLQLEGKNVTRLAVVQDVVEEFIQNRAHDRIGMVVFGEEAFTQTPLTHDHELLIRFLDQAFIGMAGDATAIGSAIAVGAKRLKELTAPSKVMILLTDGENTAGQLPPAQAAEAAKEIGVKIYTIGVGSEGKAPFEGTDLFGRKRIVYQHVRIDEALLKQVAKLTGGQYFRATNTESLKEIYQTIDELEKTEAKVKEYHEYEERFTYFLYPALFLFLLEFILARTRLRRLP